ncbi:MAG TPA: YjbQ family protein, partial [Firmicutes bacterium]|nr:YjbQ family protein [Bacillota bacterium]
MHRKRYPASGRAANGHLPRVLGKKTPSETLEGNSHAHIKASLMGSSCLIPLEDGRLQLGRWQGIFFCEF